MAVSLPLKDMTVAEKLQIMEELWEDLTRNADAFESPAWHEDVLKEREAKIASGEGKFIDWETAKAELRRQVG
jgi:hypothetical protein